MTSATEAGLGSEKGEVTGDILIALASTAVRGRVIARLRKAIASTYLTPSFTLRDNQGWSEISILSRITLSLSFCPTSALDTQLYLPEMFYIITLLLGGGPLLMRQTIYGITVNIVQSLSSTPTSGDMDAGALQILMKRLQTKEMLLQFGLVHNGSSLESAPAVNDESTLNMLEQVTRFLSEVLIAGATTIGEFRIATMNVLLIIDCANAWRARWMSLITATCFQDNLATQPQAFTVLGCLASDEVDDDLVYQILVSMKTCLSRFTDNDNIRLVSMLRCLCRVVPVLDPDSQYVEHLFWIAVGILELGYIPPFAAALELLSVSLGFLKPFSAPVLEVLMDGRDVSSIVSREAFHNLDEAAGISFGTDVQFSLVGIIYKGVRHPSSRKAAVGCLMELLALATTTAPSSSHGLISEHAVGFFMALLPIYANNPGEVPGLWAAAGIDQEAADVTTVSWLDRLSLP